MATLTVEVTGCRNDKGHAMIGIVDDPRQFPRPERPETWKGCAAEIENGRAEATFDDLAPGLWAIAVYHDENDNKKLDTNILGLPKEGYGFGNDGVRIGSPRFDDCAVLVTEEGVRTRVPIHYLGLGRR